MRRTSLRLLPLCLAVSAAVHAQEAKPDWQLCRAPATLPLFTEQFRTARVVAGEGGSVSFDRTGVTVEADGSTPILDAAEEAGVLMPSGCRMGICYGCVLPLRQGAVRDLRNGEITTAAPGDGVIIQTCINAAAGACDIDH